MTPAMREIAQLKRRGLSQREMAKELGISRRAVRDRLSGLNEREKSIDPAVAEAMRVAGTDMVPGQLWAKVKAEDGTRYSVRLDPKKQETSVEDLVEAFQDIPKVPTIIAPTNVAEDRVNLFPLFDVHLGLRAHAEYSGENVNVEIAKERLLGGVRKVFSKVEPAARAVIVNGGDFTHADDDLNATPASKHVLDVDCRNFTTVNEAIEIISTMLMLGLLTHEQVDYVSVPGNHDPKNWERIMLGLYWRFHNNPRVNIVFGPQEIAVYHWGDTMVVIHHGHKRPPQEIAAAVAALFPVMWGQTKHRFLWTGHNHNREAKRFPGVYWERFEPVTPRDHYAASMLYDQASSVSAITYALEGGEVARVKVAL